MNFNNYIPPYNSVFHYLCLKNCIRQILDYYGVSNSLFYINCVPDILIEKENILNHNYTVAYQSNVFPILPQYSYRLKRYTYLKNNFNDSWDDIISKIQEGYPVIAMVDTFELKYRYKDYHKNHGSHAIIVYDYNQFNDELLILDWYEPFFYKGPISKTEFLSARNSSNTYSNNPFSGHSLEHEWFYVEKQFWNESPYELLMNSLKLLVEYNTYNNSNTIGYYTGTKALTILFNSIMDMHTIDKNCIEKFYNNIYCEYKTKHLFLYYLITYREQNKTNMIDDIIEVLKKLCLEWDAATTLLLKSMITSSALVFDKYKKRILNVIDYEKRMVYNVMNRYTEMLYDSTLF